MAVKSQPAQQSYEAPRFNFCSANMHRDGSFLFKDTWRQRSLWKWVIVTRKGFGSIPRQTSVTSLQRPTGSLWQFQDVDLQTGFTFTRDNAGMLKMVQMNLWKTRMIHKKNMFFIHRGMNQIIFIKNPFGLWACVLSLERSQHIRSFTSVKGKTKTSEKPNAFSATLYRRRALWRKSNHVQYNLLDSLLEPQLFKMIMHKSSSDREYIGMRQQTNWPIVLYQDTEPSYLQEKKNKKPSSQFQSHGLFKKK